MKWNVEWNDIHNIAAILRLSEKMSENQMKLTYEKLEAEKELRFGSGLGDSFLLEYARIAYGVSEYSLNLLENDCRYIERIIRMGMEWEEDIWRDLYEMLINEKNNVLHTPLGDKFIAIFHDKLKLEENENFQELQHDFRQMETIYKHVNFENVENSRKTVKLLAKNESGIFHTKLGFFFMNQMKQDLHAEETTEKIQRIGLKILIYILFIACISLGSIGIYIKIHEENKLQKLQQEKVEIKNNKFTQTEQLEEQTQQSSETSQSTEESPAILPQYKKIAEQYPDFWGWIKISDTKIDYPIMQSKKKDFYLTHDYEGEESREGAVFVDSKTGNVPLDNYVVIYAHNMKNGNMFGELGSYKDKTYLQNHNTIELDTAYQTGEYEVIAVLTTHILNQEEKGFRYYRQSGYKNKEEFEKIKKFIKDNQLFEPEAEIAYGDQLVLLSTCEYSKENGRLVVVTRRKE